MGAGRRGWLTLDSRGSIGLRDQDIDRDRRVQRDPVTTPWVDALELRIDDLPRPPWRGGG
jgi:hypothetical protein